MRVKNLKSRIFHNIKNSFNARNIIYSIFGLKINDVIMGKRNIKKYNIIKLVNIKF